MTWSHRSAPESGRELAPVLDRLSAQTAKTHPFITTDAQKSELPSYALELIDIAIHRVTSLFGISAFIRGHDHFSQPIAGSAEVLRLDTPVCGPLRQLLERDRLRVAGRIQVVRLV